MKSKWKRALILALVIVWATRRPRLWFQMTEVDSRRVRGLVRSHCCRGRVRRKRPACQLARGTIRARMGLAAVTWGCLLALRWPVDCQG